MLRFQCTSCTLYVVQSKLKRVLYQIDFRAQARRTSTTDTVNTCNGEGIGRGTSKERWFGECERRGGGECEEGRRV